MRRLSSKRDRRASVCCTLISDQVFGELFPHVSVVNPGRRTTKALVQVCGGVNDHDQRTIPQVLLFRYSCAYYRDQQ